MTAFITLTEVFFSRLYLSNGGPFGMVVIRLSSVCPTDALWLGVRL